MQPPSLTEPERTKILITVKTYPQLSGSHTETVCTAGVREGGRWVRIYPIAYRYLNPTQQFRKYQWIEADIVRDMRDPRPESYRLVGDITPLGFINTKDAWEARKRFVLGKVYYRLKTLVDEARDTNVFTSLAVFKPHIIHGLTMVRDDSTKERSKKQRALAEQLPEDVAAKLAEAVPFRFYYTFEDQLGTSSTLQILDWEIYQLCRKLMRKYGASKKAIYPHLYEKYVTNLTARREVYFFLGTNKQWHIRRSKNPFMIVGVFYPPKG